MLRIIKSKTNLIPNITKIEKLLRKQPDIKPSDNSVYSHNTDSYKTVYSLNTEFKSNYEYQQIWEKIGSPSNFTVEDMKWIDENLYEDKTVQS